MDFLNFASIWSLREGVSGCVELTGVVGSKRIFYCVELYVSLWQFKECDQESVPIRGKYSQDRI